MTTTTHEQLAHLTRAGATVLHIASPEWERVQALAIQLGPAAGDLPLRIWSKSAGMARCSSDGELTFEDASATDPIEVLKEIHASPRPGVWLLEDFHPYLDGHEAHVVIRWVRELARMPLVPRKVVLLSTPRVTLPPDLRKEVPTVELPLPGREQLEQVLSQAARTTGVRCEADDALIDAARGLTVMEARLAFGRAAAELDRLDHTAVPSVAREKARIIQESAVLEHIPSDARMDEVGGLDTLKSWLDRRGRAFGSGAREFGLDAPKGVLLLGVQGCGKSLCAKAVAAAWQFPLLRLDVGRVFGGLVGESEGNIREALRITQALAPCVLWIDEIEKGIAGMGSSDRSDGGTTARVVGTLLTWMQEKRDPVFVVATANSVDLLPPELLRKGRFDEIFFVDLPTEQVRRDILGIHLRRKRRDPARFDLDALARAAAGYSGAELEEAVREGLFNAFAEGRELATEHVAMALEATYPLSRTMREKIEGLRAWARVRARFAASEESEPLPADREHDAPSSRNPFVRRTEVSS
jgi:AAA+ superfamily predicted ATPase